MTITIAIRKVNEPFGFLSNMSPHSLKGEDVFYPTAEHLFQRMRFPADSEVGKKMLLIRNPMKAKWFAKANAASMIVAPMSPHDVGNMRIVLRSKVIRHPDILTLLLATGDQHIVEDCSNRRGGSGLFWGAALVGAPGHEEWVGVNMLGKLWMQLRADSYSPGFGRREI